MVAMLAAAIGAVVGIGGLIGMGLNYVTAVVAPIQRDIVALRSDLDKNAVADERSIENRVEITAKIAAVEMQFKEIETQFKNLNERTQRMDDMEKNDIKTLDARLQGEIAVVRKLLDDISEVSVRQRKISSK